MDYLAMAILFLMLCFGFVFCMEFEKAVKKTIQNKVVWRGLWQGKEKGRKGVNKRNNGR